MHPNHTPQLPGTRWHPLRPTPTHTALVSLRQGRTRMEGGLGLGVGGWLPLRARPCPQWQEPSLTRGGTPWESSSPGRGKRTPAGRMGVSELESDGCWIGGLGLPLQYRPAPPETQSLTDPLSPSTGRGVARRTPGEESDRRVASGLVGGILSRVGTGAPTRDGGGWSPAPPPSAQPHSFHPPVLNGEHPMRTGEWGGSGRADGG